MAARAAACRVWVIDQRVDAATFERLGDARELADACGERVGALIVGGCADPDALIAAGADCVKIVDGGSSGATDVAMREAAGADETSTRGPRWRLSNAETALANEIPRVVFASGAPDGREWAARLAVRRGWRLFSPALQARVGRDGRLSVVALSACGRYSRTVALDDAETAVLALQPGVAEATPPDADRSGSVDRIDAVGVEAEAVRVERELPADPREVDIRYAERIVAGGRGVGGPEGFALLARVADQLKAGIAASRVAVDLGWVDRERQVGQTGKTVAPELYLACGISGASHHLAGITDARCVVAINTDPSAPIFQAAHLGVVADLHAVLAQLEGQLTAGSRPVA